MADGEAERYFDHPEIPVTGRIYTNAPVQGEGMAGGQPFAFHARGEAWIFTIGEEPGQSAIGVLLIDGDSGFVRSGTYGTTPFAASWMPFEEAESIIVRCAKEFVLENTGRREV